MIVDLLPFKLYNNVRMCEITSSWNLSWLLNASNSRKHTLMEAANSDNRSDCSNYKHNTYI